VGAEEIDAVCCCGDDVQVWDEEARDVNVAPCTALETGLNYAEFGRGTDEQGIGKETDGSGTRVDC